MPVTVLNRWHRFELRLGSVAGIALAIFFVAGLRSTEAVILYEQGGAAPYDPAANTSAPTGALAGSGWQDEGTFDGFLGTAIAPNYFVTAAHFGGSVGDSFNFGGTSYTTTAVYRDPASDLQVWQVGGTLPTYAPLYSGGPGSEVNLSLVVFGKGTQRGAAYTLPNSQLGGWLWGPGDGVQRWGTNVVGSIETDPSFGPLLRAPFDASGGANEAQLSAGDSGGGVFIYNPDAARWELAGVNLGVDGNFSASPDGSNPFTGALFNTTGLYQQNGQGQWVAAVNPSAFYATEIAAHMAFLNSVIAVPEPATWLAGVLSLAWMTTRLKRRWPR